MSERRGARGEKRGKDDPRGENSREGEKVNVKKRKREPARRRRGAKKKKKRRPSPWFSAGNSNYPAVAVRARQDVRRRPRARCRSRRWAAGAARRGNVGKYWLSHAPLAAAAAGATASAVGTCGKQPPPGRRPCFAAAGPNLLTEPLRLRRRRRRRRRRKRDTAAAAAFASLLSCGRLPYDIPFLWALIVLSIVSKLLSRPNARAVGKTISSAAAFELSLFSFRRRFSTQKAHESVRLPPTCSAKNSGKTD